MSKSDSNKNFNGSSTSQHIRQRLYHYGTSDSELLSAIKDESRSPDTIGGEVDHLRALLNDSPSGLGYIPFSKAGKSIIDNSSNSPLRKSTVIPS